MVLLDPEGRLAVTEVPAVGMVVGRPLHGAHELNVERHLSIGGGGRDGCFTRTQDAPAEQDGKDREGGDGEQRTAIVYRHCLCLWDWE